MNIFSRNTNTSSKATGAKKAGPSKTAVAHADGRHHTVLQAPWLSEKALIGTEKGIYVFKVPASATKQQVAEAIHVIYNVAPRQVRMVNLPAKKKALRTRNGQGTRAARHKAYVYLQKGDTIQF